MGKHGPFDPICTRPQWDRRAGIVDVASGTGGATIARRAVNVTLLDIYQAVEPTRLGDAIGIHYSGNPDCPVAQNIADMLSDYRKRIGVQDQAAGS